MTQQLEVPAFLPPELPRPQHAAPTKKRGVLLAAGVAAAVLIATAVGVISLTRGGSSPQGAAAPAVADAETACRGAFQTAFEQGDRERKAQFAREEPDFIFLTAMGDVNVWESATVGTTVVVSGDVEWTLTTGILGPDSKTTDFTCTASVQESKIVTTVS